MAVTRLASMRLARPSTAFCSCSGGRDAAQAWRRRAAGRPDSRRSRPRQPGFTSPSSLKAAAMPRSSIQPVRAAATGERAGERGGGNAIDGARGKVRAVAVAAHVGHEIDGDGAPAELLRQGEGRERDGRRCRPAASITDLVRHDAPPSPSPSHVAGLGHESRLFDARRIGPAPRHGQQHAHRQADRKHGGAAAGNERQRHALGRDEPDVDGHVDDRLQREQAGPARPRPAARSVIGSVDMAREHPHRHQARTGRGSPGRRARRTPRR